MGAYHFKKDLKSLFFTPKKIVYQVKMVFVIDTTFSMSDHINNIV
jgi:hypothetical protein